MKSALAARVVLRVFLFPRLGERRGDETRGEGHHAQPEHQVHERIQNLRERTDLLNVVLSHFKTPSGAVPTTTT